MSKQHQNWKEYEDCGGCLTIFLGGGLTYYLYAASVKPAWYIIALLYVGTITNVWLLPLIVERIVSSVGAVCRACARHPLGCICALATGAIGWWSWLETTRPLPPSLAISQQALVASIDTSARSLHELQDSVATKLSLVSIGHYRQPLTDDNIAGRIPALLEFVDQLLADGEETERMHRLVVLQLERYLHALTREPQRLRAAAAKMKVKGGTSFYQDSKENYSALADFLSRYAHECEEQRAAVAPFKVAVEDNLGYLTETLEFLRDIRSILQESPVIPDAEMIDALFTKLTSYVKGFSRLQAHLKGLNEQILQQAPPPDQAALRQKSNRRSTHSSPGDSDIRLPAHI